MALTPRPTHYPNVNDLTSANPAMKFFDAALAEVGTGQADLYEVLANGKPDRPLPNTAHVARGKNALLDAVMDRAAELAAAG